jgi:hypothetical protein
LDHRNSGLHGHTLDYPVFWINRLKTPNKMPTIRDMCQRSRSMFYLSLVLASMVGGIPTYIILNNHKLLKANHIEIKESKARHDKTDSLLLLVIQLDSVQLRNNNLLEVKLESLKPKAKK